MADAAERIPLSEEKRKELDNKLKKYRGRMDFTPEYAPPELRAATHAWYAYFMTWFVLEKGYFDADELREAVVNNVGTYLDVEEFENRVGVIQDYLLNNGAYTYKKYRE